MGIAALSAYRGDLVLAQAAQRAGIPMIMSGSSLIRLEAVAQAAPQTWFQAYLPGESAKIHALVERVGRAGYQTLVLTVDTAVLANRENNVRAGFSTPLRPSLRLAMDWLTHPRWLFGTALKTLVKHGMPHFENSHATRGAPIFSGRVARDFGAKDHLNWRHVDEIRRQWKGTLIVKGLLAVDDARAARDHCVDGIIVSNHGGRQLDGAAAPLRVLPAIAEAVGAQMPVMIDGGIRRGTDVLKALALGADFVFVGRPFNYAAAIAGEVGVDHAIAILRTEVQRNLGLLGLNALDELGPHVLMKIGG
jgi:L-lactate dehydrogenase (cytochrome)